LFVVFHLVALMLMALPAPGSAGMKRSAWAHPTVQGEFQAWTDRLNALGVATTSEQLEDHIWEIASAYTAIRGDVLAPLMPYYRYSGSWQSWRMFVAPHRFPSTLHIELQSEAGGDWEPLYVKGSDEHTWHKRQLEHDRMLSSSFRYDWKPYRSTYRRLADWVGRHAATELPNAHAVRVRLFKYRTRTPEEVRSGAEVDGDFQQTAVRRLGKYRHPQVAP